MGIVAMRAVGGLGGRFGGSEAWMGWVCRRVT